MTWQSCVLLALCLAGATLAWGEETQDSRGGGGSRSTAARLDFQVNIDRMIFFRVGAGSGHGGGTSGTGPAASGVVSAVDFNLAPLVVPGGGTTATNGNRQAADWNGTAPVYASPFVLLPVEVRSNAGTVSITAQATVPLSSGTFQIPLSEVIVTSSDPGNLPAPAIPDTGSGAAVTVATGGTGTGAAPTLLTYRTATWRFRYTPVTAPVAGAYTGQITFTATAP